MPVQYGSPADIGPWMDLVRRVRDSFPGLETDSALARHRAQVLGFMAEGHALCVKEGETLAAVALFSPEHNTICCLAVSPAHRRRGLAAALLTELLLCLDRQRDVTVTTFREDDPRGAAPRALYRRFGFEEGRFLEEFGWPCQEFVLRPGV